MPAEGRENPLLKKGNFDTFFREKYLTKNKHADLVSRYGIRQAPTLVVVHGDQSEAYRSASEIRRYATEQR